jgi:hypothetical protein
MIIVHSAPARRVAHHAAALLRWPSDIKRITVRTLHHDRRRCSLGRHWTHGQAASPRPPCLVPPAPPRAGRLVLSQPALAVAIAARSRAADARASRPAEASRDRPGAPAPPDPRPVAHGPRRPSATASASAASCGRSRPHTAGDSGGAPPRAFWRPRTGSIAGLHTPRRCPGRINPPEPARVKASWRTHGGHVENARPALRRAFRGPTSPSPQLSWVQVPPPSCVPPGGGTDRRQTRPVPGPRVPPSWCGPPGRPRPVRPQSGLRAAIVQCTCLQLHE